jgi:FkbM family methyltransferase
LVEFGGWSIRPEGLGPASVVYSFGVGDNVAWDLEMIRRFGCTVHAFDPTPASVAWVARQSLPPQFVFHDCGIASYDGTLDFYPPRKEGNTHYSHERRGRWFDRRKPVGGRVERLSTIMRRLGNDHIDVLKIDVEGSEFEVIPDVVQSAIPVEQLLVEIHYRFRSRSFRQGMALIDRVKASGMRCVHVSERGFEFSFLGSGLPLSHSLRANDSMGDLTPRD